MSAPQGQQQNPAPSKGSGAATLQNAVINLVALREHSRQALIDVLDSQRGKKTLVLDRSLSGSLGLVAEVATLKEHGVDKILYLTPGPLDTDTRNVLYIVRPRPELMEIVAQQIHDAPAGQPRDHAMFFVPRRTLLCEKVLEAKGVYGDLELGEYDLDLIPIDEDVLSMELPTSFRDVALNGDRTSLFYVARSLMKLQALYGVIPSVKGKGEWSRQVYEMMVRMGRERAGDQPAVPPEIDTLVLLDRSADLVSPLATQLTYEGLIDEIFGIQNGYVDLDPEIVGNTNATKKIKTALNSNDRLFGEIRDLSFNVLGPLLNKRANIISENYNERHQAQTVSQIRDFMKKLNQLQQDHHSLQIHTNLAERISQYTRTLSFSHRLEAEHALLEGPDSVLNYIEECINRQEPLAKVLRIICMQSITNGGFKQKTFNHLRREILQTYGYDKIFTLENLEKLGMFRMQQAKSSWEKLRKQLHLIVDDVDDAKPTDIAYTHSGYAPLSVRLVQYAHRPGWGSIQDVMKILPGPAFEERQHLPQGVVQEPRKRSITLVFFVGGVTQAEIAALRFLSQQDDSRDYIVASTSICNGTTLVESVSETIVNNIVIN